MAEEEIVSASVSPAPSDHNKRKLEDLEPNAPEPPSVEEPEPKADLVKEAEQADGADGYEAKRPRLEDKPDGLAVQNGYQGETDEVHKPQEHDEEQPTAAANNVPSEEDGQEQAGESLESVKSEEPVDPDQHAKDAELHADDAEDKEKEESAEVVQEPGEEVPKQGDDEQREASDTQTTTKKMEVPNNKVGVLIGKAGDTIRYLQYNSGAKIQIMRDADADPRSATRPVELIGTLENINKAEKLIKDVIAEADAGGSPSLVARGFSTVQAVVGDQIEIQVPNEKVGLIIGKGGETIKNLQTRSGARIQLIPQHAPEGDQLKERTVRVTGDRKQIEVAREMIKEVMSQPVRPSPLSGGYGQQAFRPRGPAASQWGPRGPHPGQFGGYDYHQRGPFPSQSSQYPPSSYGGYPPQQAPRSGYGSGWEQRPPSSMQGPQGSYNYGQPQRSEYGQPPYSQAHPGQSYGHGYGDVKYETQTSVQHPYGGHGVSQPAAYPQGVGHPSYGAPDQYGKPSSYGMAPQGPPVQPYGQPRPSQPGDVPYQGTISSAQPYGQNVPPQQQYPYASTGPQQTYPSYGSAPTADAYHHQQPTSAAAPGYPQQAGQPVSGYGQPAAHQPAAYVQAGPTGGYASYPSQPGYTEQPAANNPGYGYQGQVDPTYASAPASATYAAPSATQPGYAQPAPTQSGYDQSIPQSGAYGSVPAAAAVYGKSASPQAAYAQYDASQMYSAPH